MKDRIYKLYKDKKLKKIISLTGAAVMFGKILGGNVANITNVIDIPNLGIINAQAAETGTSMDDDMIIPIPDNVLDDVQLGIEYVLEDWDYFDDHDYITLSDLKKIKTLDLWDIDCDLSWTKYCENLEVLNIDLGPDCKNSSKLKEFDFSNVKKLTLYLKGTGNIFEFNEEDFSFLEKYHFDKLCINASEIDMGNSEVVTKINANTLYINFKGYHSKINYTAFTNVKNIKIGSIAPYDLAIGLSKEKIAMLKSKGINVTVDLSPEEYDKYTECCDKLNEVYNSLQISDKDSYIEKINKILVYILENYEYDPTIRRMTNNNEDYTEPARKMYEEGGLTPFMNGSKYLICGNYASLLSALLTRANVDSYIITSRIHAWNLVEVDGEYYYFDPTWLDGSQIGEMGEATYNEDGMVTYEMNFISFQEILEKGKDIPEDFWYKVLVDNAESLDTTGDHNAIYTPNYVDLNPESDKNVPDISNKKFKIKLGTKEFIIAGSVLVGIMVALGGAVMVVNKKRKEAIKRKQHEDNLNRLRTYGFDPNDPYYSYNSGSDNYGGFNF